jgi:hypothetical protein
MADVMNISDLSSLNFYDRWAEQEQVRTEFVQRFAKGDPIRVQFSLPTGTPPPTVELTGLQRECAEVEFIYVGATPEVVRKRYFIGDRIILPSPSELGMSVLPEYTFRSWTYLGSDVTEIVVDGDIALEARYDFIGANLIRETRHRTSYSSRGDYWYVYSQNVGGTSEGAGEWIKGSDYDITRIQGHHNYRNGYICFRPAVSSVIPTGSKFVFSFFMKSTVAIANRAVSIGVSVNFDGQTKETYVDGVKSSDVPFDGKTHFVEVIATTTKEMPVQDGTAAGMPTPQDVWIVNLNGIAILNESTFRYVDVWLPKLEDVSTRTTEMQRATPWVQHVDDPIEAVTFARLMRSVIIPTYVDISAGGTLTPNLVGQSSDRDFYNVDFYAPGKGVWRFDMYYDPESTIASTVFNVDSDVSDTKLVQFNNYKNGENTVFIDGNPFYARFEMRLFPQNISFKSDTNTFRDQHHRLSQLSANPVTSYKFIFGGRYGAPIWYGNKINRIFAMSEVLINGEEFVKSDGSDIEMSVIAPMYPRYRYALTCEKVNDGAKDVPFEIIT